MHSPSILFREFLQGMRHLLCRPISASQVAAACQNFDQVAENWQQLLLLSLSILLPPSAIVAAI